MRPKNLLLTSGIAAALAASPLTVADEHDEEDELEFDVAEVFFELNNTDGDLGIHALIDGEPWKRLAIEDHRERKIMKVNARGRLRRQGITEIFFESAEPTFDELPAEAFFSRFPQGTYEVEGRTLDGQEIESETEITHAMPAPPEPTVNGEFSDDCDADVPGVSAPVVISWPAVTTTHPELGDPQGSDDITIVNYQVVVEADIIIDDEEFTTIFSAIVPPDVTSMTIPDEFLAQGDGEFKYEVLAREESYNQTAVESCFELE